MDDEEGTDGENSTGGYSPGRKHANGRQAKKNNVQDLDVILDEDEENDPETE